jgi:hypothetical protein
LLRALDGICLTNSVIVSLLVVEVFGAPMNWLQWLQAVLYGVVSAVQLLVMLWKKDLYQQYRFKVRFSIVGSTQSRARYSSLSLNPKPQPKWLKPHKSTHH